MNKGHFFLFFFGGGRGLKIVKTSLFTKFNLNHSLYVYIKGVKGIQLDLNFSVYNYLNLNLHDYEKEKTTHNY